MSDVTARLSSALGDRYRVERELGSGGMAIVYLAEDLKHHRKVALKVLRPELAAALGSERFLQEIRTTATLQHPHILPLFDSGEAGGFLYYVMPYVAGGSLRERLARDKQLPLDVAIAIAREVATALDSAHRRGVVHRDIKPANILLAEGSAVVADFGIARAVTAAGGAKLTTTGIVVGTPEYMSPEQASGDQDVDGRSDVYALGCLLYEMLAGEPPFTGPTAQAIMAKRFANPPPSVRRLRGAAPTHVDAAIRRALATVPADRFTRTEDFAAALTRPDTPASWRSIAVLPFTNLSADPENAYFSDGITEDLIAQVSKIPNLKVISRTSTARYKGVDKPLRLIADELGVASILEGTVRRVGNRVRVVAQLIDASSDEHRWAETYDRDLTDVFAIQSDVAVRVAAALRTALSPAERERLQRRPTESMEAYDLYLLGRHQASMRSDDGLRRAIEYFERALAIDGGYAAAHAGLADAYVLSGMGYRAVPPRDANAMAEKHALKAIALDDMLPEAHAALGYVYISDWQWQRAHDALTRAIDLNPSYAQAHQWMAHYFLVSRDFESAVAESERARELDPWSVAITNELGWPYSYMGESARARECHVRARDMDPSFAMAHFNIAATYIEEGEYAEAIPHCLRAVELGGRLPFMIAMLARCYACSGRTDEARAILHELTAGADLAHGVQMWIACVHEALGERELAIDWIERAYQSRAPMLAVIDTEFLPFAGVRDDPRFCAVLEKMGVARRHTTQPSSQRDA